MRGLATVTALWLCGLPVALTQAQTQDWVVLPTTERPDTDWMEASVATMGGELRRQAVGVWSSDQAVAAFEKRASAPPTAVSAARVDAWIARSQAGLRMLALGNETEGLAELRSAYDFARAESSALNRDASQARMALDTCLYLTRAVLQAEGSKRATDQAQECVQLVPSGEPSIQMHPPQVLELYESARAPGSLHTGTLIVESQPSACAARVNGVLLGDTPLELGDLYAGVYRVDVECESGRRGRVHSVQVSDGQTSLFIFDRFDRAVRTVPVLHLEYDESTDPQQLARDGRQIARVLPASAVLHLSMDRDDAMDLRLFTATRQESTLVRIPSTSSGPKTSAARRAAEALLSAECIDFTVSPPQAIDCRSGDPVEQSAAARGPATKRTPRAQFVSGVTLASLGTASLLGSYALLIARRPAGEEWVEDPGSLSAQSRWLGLGTGVIVTSSVGAALLVSAMPLALPLRAKTPWWAWLSGGLGLGAAAAAIASAAIAGPKPDPSCSVNTLDPAHCVSRARDTDRAIVLGTSAAPLLTVPLVYLLRRGDKRLDVDLSPTLTAGRGTGEFGLRGVF